MWTPSLTLWPQWPGSGEPPAIQEPTPIPGSHVPLSNCSSHSGLEMLTNGCFSVYIRVQHWYSLREAEAAFP